MVSRAFKTCLELVEKMVKHQFVNQISRAELEKLICMYIGADSRTIEKYSRVCVQFELLKPHIIKKDKGTTVFKIDLMKAHKYIMEVLGRDLRQLQLLE